MKLFGYTARLIRRRPLAVALLGAAVLLYCIADRFNPLIPILMGLGGATEGGVFENTISFLQLALDPEVMPALLLFLILFSAASAAIAGAVFSILFQMIYNALEGKKRTKEEITGSLRKNFLRMALISLRVIAAGAATVIILLVASVPAMIAINASRSGKPELFLAALFISLLTAGIILFGLLFYRAYMFFWYPAAFYGERRAFPAAKKVVDRNFWSIAGKLLFFDAFFVLFQALITSMPDTILSFILEWLFGTAFLMLFFTYLFTAYKRYAVSGRESGG